MWKRYLMLWVIRALAVALIVCSFRLYIDSGEIIITNSPVAIGDALKPAYAITLLPVEKIPYAPSDYYVPAQDDKPTWLGQPLACLYRSILNQLPPKTVAPEVCLDLPKDIELKPGIANDIKAVTRVAYASSNGMKRYDMYVRIHFWWYCLFVLSIYLGMLACASSLRQVKAIYFNVLLVVGFFFSLLPLSFWSLRTSLLHDVAKNYYLYGFSDYSGISGPLVPLSGIFGFILLSGWACYLRLGRGLLSRLGRLMDMIGAIPPKWYVGGAMCLFLAAAVTLSLVMFDGMPHIADTYSQYVHAKIMARGNLYEPTHKFPQFFHFQTMINENGKYFSGYPPGHIFMLAIGVFFHVPWLVNPLLGALSVGAIYLLTNELANRRAAYVAVALALTSPFILFMSSEYMSHATALLFLTLFIYGYIKFQKTHAPRFAWMAGACIGYAMLTRPQAALPFATPVMLHALWLVYTQPKRYLPTLAYMAGAFVLLAGCMAAYIIINYGYTMTFMGFNPLKLILPFFTTGHYYGLNQDLTRLLVQVNMLHTQLLGWPTASLLCVFLLFLFRAAPPYAWLVIACCLGQMLALIINPFFEGIFGPRNLYETAGCLIALVAIFLHRLPAMVAPYLKAPLQCLRGLVAFDVLVLVVIAYFATNRGLYAVYSQNYWEGNTEYSNKIIDSVKKPALVFMVNYSEYRMMYFLQPPWDENPVIIARDRKAEHNKLLIGHYPNRYVYTVDGWNITPVPNPNMPLSQQ